jgi:shikimate 5-dehydrogenase
MPEPVSSPPRQPLVRPTLYFIGVTTQQSSIMRIFPAWARILGLDADLVGHDIALSAPADAYRAIVGHLARDPLARGALVTTHKIDLMTAARDLFAEFDAYALGLGEVSCISKDAAGGLVGHAKDPYSSASALAAFVPAGHWARWPDAEVLSLGGGGAAAAITLHIRASAQSDAMASRRAEAAADPADSLADTYRAAYPARVTVVEIDAARIAHLREAHDRLAAGSPVALDTVQAEAGDSGAANDARIAALPPGSLVINATGMGKDRPGSPITDAARFPDGALVWELNYRGTLEFLKQAHAQAAARPEAGLTVVDGWEYFLYGWTAVVGEVFGREITPALFRALAEAAAAAR